MGWPTTTNRRSEFVTLRLTVEEAAGLDEMALATSRTRSAVVRSAVVKAVAAHAKKRAKIQKAEQEQEQAREGDAS